MEIALLVGLTGDGTAAASRPAAGFDPGGVAMLRPVITLTAGSERPHGGRAGMAALCRRSIRGPPRDMPAWPSSTWRRTPCAGGYTSASMSSRAAISHRAELLARSCWPAVLTGRQLTNASASPCTAAAASAGAWRYNLHLDPDGSECAASSSSSGRSLRPLAHIIPATSMAKPVVHLSAVRPQRSQADGKGES